MSNQNSKFVSSLSKKYYNSDEFIVIDFDDEHFYLRTSKNDTNRHECRLRVDIKFTNHFKPVACLVSCSGFLYLPASVC